MGWTEEQFWDSTLRATTNAITGYSNREQEAYRDRWEQTRMIAFYAVKPHTKEGALKRIVDLFPLPWDQKQTVRTLTEDEKNRLKKWDHDRSGGT